MLSDHQNISTRRGRGSQGTCDSEGLGCFPTSANPVIPALAEMTGVAGWRATCIACYFLNVSLTAMAKCASQFRVFAKNLCRRLNFWRFSEETYVGIISSFLSAPKMEHTSIEAQLKM